LSPLVVKRLLKKNSEPHTWARPSVRLCVRPEFARCVHKLSFERRPTKTKFVLLNFPDLQWAPKLQAASEPTPPIQFPGAFLMWLRDSGTKEARHSFTSLWDLGAPAAKVCVQAAFAVVIMCERAEPDGIGAEFSALKHNASCFIAIC
jgi:hypothetical protein